MATRNLNPDTTLSKALREHSESVARNELLIFQLQQELADSQTQVKRLEEDLKFSQKRRQELLKKTR